MLVTCHSQLHQIRAFFEGHTHQEKNCVINLWTPNLQERNFLLDLGSHSCEAGYAGEDQPKCVFPFCTIPFFLTFKPRAFQWVSECFDLGRPTTFTPRSGRAAASSSLEPKCILHIAIAVPALMMKTFLCKKLGNCSLSSESKVDPNANPSRAKHYWFHSKLTLTRIQVVQAVEQTAVLSDHGTNTDMEAKKPVESENVKAGRKLYTSFSAFN